MLNNILAALLLWVLVWINALLYPFVFIKKMLHGLWDTFLYVILKSIDSKMLIFYLSIMFFPFIVLPYCVFRLQKQKKTFSWTDFKNYL